LVVEPSSDKPAAAIDIVALRGPAMAGKARE